MNVDGVMDLHAILAQDLREGPESFDPQWLQQHLDQDRLRAHYGPDFLLMVQEEGLEGDAAVVEAERRLIAWINDPTELLLVLGEELPHYLDVEAAARQAIAYGLDHAPAEIQAQLDELNLLDEDDSEEDHRGGHRPSSNGAPLHDLTLGDTFPPDVYSTLRRYTHGGSNRYDEESIRTIQQVRGRPDAMVRIFRAVPRGVDEIRRGDWVALSHDYAAMHGEARDSERWDTEEQRWIDYDPPRDYPVLEATVPASTIRSGGNDILEWGYWGDTLRGDQIKLWAQQKDWPTGPGILKDPPDASHPLLNPNDRDLDPVLEEGAFLTKHYTRAAVYANNWASPDDPPVVLTVDASGMDATSDNDARSAFVPDQIVQIAREVVEHASAYLRSGDELDYDHMVDRIRLHGDSYPSIDTDLDLARHVLDPEDTVSGEDLYDSLLSMYPEKQDFARAVVQIATTGQVPDSVIRNVMGNYRYTNDVPVHRIICVTRFKPWKDELLDAFDEDDVEDMEGVREDEDGDLIDDEGYVVYNRDYTGELPGERVIWEHPQLNLPGVFPEEQRLYHGTTRSNAEKILGFPLQAQESLDNRLYHGTLGDFDEEPSAVSGGGVLWTATSPAVAQTYLVSGGVTGNMFTSLNQLFSRTEPSGLAFPNTEEAVAILKQMGRDPGEYRVERGRVTDIGLTTSWQEVVDYFVSLGYLDVADRDGYARLNLHTDGYGDEMKLLPADHQIEGRLYILEGRDRLNLLDLRRSDESDLLDVEYNDLSLFEEANTAGYDGIIINDFAQTPNHGNVGHISVGLFQRGLDKMTITSIPVNPFDWGDSVHEQETPEYVEWRSRRSAQEEWSLPPQPSNTIYYHGTPTWEQVLRDGLRPGSMLTDDWSDATTRTKGGRVLEVDITGLNVVPYGGFTWDWVRTVDFVPPERIHIRSRRSAQKEPWTLSVDEFLKELNPEHRKHPSGAVPRTTIHDWEWENPRQHFPRREGVYRAKDGTRVELRWSEGDDEYQSLAAFVDGTFVGIIEANCPTGESIDTSRRSETVLNVVDEYNGLGIGTLLYRALLKHFPGVLSGGFTDAGEGTARAVHREEVEDALRRGEPDIDPNAVLPEQVFPAVAARPNRPVHFTPLRNLGSILRTGFDPEWEDRPSAKHGEHLVSIPGHVYFVNPSDDNKLSARAGDTYEEPSRRAAFEVSIDPAEMVADEDWLEELTWNSNDEGLESWLESSGASVDDAFHKLLSRAVTQPGEDAEDLYGSYDPGLRRDAIAALASYGMDGAASYHSHGTAAYPGRIDSQKIIGFFVPIGTDVNYPGWSRSGEVTMAGYRWDEYRRGEAVEAQSRDEGGEISYDESGTKRWGRRAAGLLIYREDGRVLLTLRSPEVYDPNVWGIPGGRVEPGEDEWDGAVGETREELGSLPEVRRIDQHVYRSGGFTYTTFIVQMTDEDAERFVPRLNWENTDWGWFDPNDLPFPMHSGVVSVLERGVSLESQSTGLGIEHFYDDPSQVARWSSGATDQELAEAVRYINEQMLWGNTPEAPHAVLKQSVYELERELNRRHTSYRRTSVEAAGLKPQPQLLEEARSAVHEMFAERVCVYVNDQLNQYPDDADLTKLFDVVKDELKKTPTKEGYSDYRTIQAYPIGAQDAQDSMFRSTVHFNLGVPGSYFSPKDMSIHIGAPFIDNVWAWERTKEDIDSAVRHEVQHLMQYVTRVSLGLKEPAGLPPRSVRDPEIDHYGIPEDYPKRDRVPHSLRDIEFYPDLQDQAETVVENMRGWPRKDWGWYLRQHLGDLGKPMSDRGSKPLPDPLRTMFEKDPERWKVAVPRFLAIVQELLGPKDWADVVKNLGMDRRADMSREARPMMYWHGTTDLNARTILSQGLVQGVGPSVWGGDESQYPQPPANDATDLDHRNYRQTMLDMMESIQNKSYGGTYFTQDWITAWYSAKQACSVNGGNPLVVAAILEPRSPSILLDEDVMPNPAYTFKDMFIPITMEAMTDWFASGKTDLARIVDRYLGDFRYSRRDVPKITQERLRYARVATAKMLVAWMERELAEGILERQVMQSGSSRRDSELERVEQVFPEALDWDFREKEEQYRAAVHKFMRATNWTANAQPQREWESSNTNVRVLDPVTYSGANRIILISRVRKEYDSVTFEILYGSDQAAIDYLKTQAVQTIHPNADVIVVPVGQSVQAQSRWMLPELDEDGPEFDTYYTTPPTRRDVELSDQYRGRKVVWLGEAGRMLRVDASNLRPREDNIFDYDKLAAVKNHIVATEGPIYIPAAVAQVRVIDLVDVEETQRAAHANRLEEYGYLDRPFTTGDDDLDAYLVDPKEWHNSQFYLDYDEWIAATQRGDVASYFDGVEIPSVENPVQAWEEANRGHEEMRQALDEAVAQHHGDLGGLDVSLRDGNHRAFGALAAGEPWVWVIVAKDMLDPQAQPLLATRAEDEGNEPYLYHVTTRSRLSSIADQGLGGGASNWSGSFYGDYSAGDTFLCSADGVSYWFERISNTVEHNFEPEEQEENVPVLLRVDVAGLDEDAFVEDTLGTRDSMASSWRYTSVIEPTYIEAWDAKGWHSIDEATEQLEGISTSEMTHYEGEEPWPDVTFHLPEGWEIQSQHVETERREGPFYHGTTEQFSRFEIGRPTQRGLLPFGTLYDVESQGISLAPTLQDAKDFGPIILECYVNLENPFFDYERDSDTYPNTRQQRVILDMLEAISKEGELLDKTRVRYVDLGANSYTENQWTDFDKFWLPDGLRWELMDEPAAVAKLKEHGFDSTWVQEDYGTSLFVMDPNKVQIVRRVTDQEIDDSEEEYVRKSPLDPDM